MTGSHPAPVRACGRSELVAEKAAELKIYRDARAASARGAEKERIEANMAKVMSNRPADKTVSGATGL